MTVLDLLTAALAELNVYDAGTAIPPDQAQFAFDRLNDYLDALATEGLTIYQVTRVTWTLTPNVATYTIGPGATINTTRPVNPQAIVNIGFQDTSVSPVQEYPGLSILGADEYASLSLKTQTSPYPTRFYYNPTFGTTGFGTIMPFPVPTASNLQGVIYVPTPVSELTSQSATLSLPPGYRRFLRLNLAVELAGAFQVQLPQGLDERAQRAKSMIKAANIRMMDLVTWPSGHYSIYSDSYE